MRPREGGERRWLVGVGWMDGCMDWEGEREEAYHALLQVTAIRNLDLRHGVGDEVRVCF